jgi:hypothetical protein
MNEREISKNMSRSPGNNNSLTIQQYDLFQNGYKQPDYDRRISFDTKMFLNSSKSIKSKILEAAIQIDEDYKKYRQTKETGLCKYAASASNTICQKC